MPVPRVRELLEHGKRAPTKRVQGLGRALVTLQRETDAHQALGCRPRREPGIAEALAHDDAMHFGVLAYVERREVEPEGIDPTQQARDVEEPGARTLVGREAGGHQAHVGRELRRVLVALRAAVVGVAQPRGDQRAELAVRHPVVARRGTRVRGRHQGRIFVDLGLQRLGHTDATGALREPLTEALDLEEVRVDDHEVLALQGFPDRLGVHVGRAIHVATDPGTETEQSRQVRRLHVGLEGAGQRRGELLIEARHDPVHHLREEEQHVLAFVRHRQALARVLLGLPPGGEFRADLLPGRAALAGGHRRVQAIEQQLRDALLLAQDRAPRGLGRMPGEDRIDADPIEQCPDVTQRPAFAREAQQRVADATRLRLRGIVQVLAAPPDPVHLLGEGDDLEPGRDRTHEVAGLGRLATAGPREQRVFAALVALSATDRGDTVPLDLVEAELPALFEQDLADERAERMHVFAQRSVLGGELDVLAVHRGGTRAGGARAAMISAHPGRRSAKAVSAARRHPGHGP